MTEPAPVAALAVVVVAMAVVALAAQHVPVVHMDASRPGLGLPTRSRPRSRGPLAAGETVDLSTATASDIERLPGVGPRLAQRIVERRSLGLRSLADLDEVSGVGPKLLEKIAPYVTFGAQRSNGNPTRNVNPSMNGPRSEP